MACSADHPLVNETELWDHGLRSHTRKKTGTLYEYWTLEKSVRTKEGPRQRTVATLGKLPGLNEETRIGWGTHPRCARWASGARRFVVL